MTSIRHTHSTSKQPKVTETMDKYLSDTSKHADDVRHGEDILEAISDSGEQGTATSELHSKVTSLQYSTIQTLFKDFQKSFTESLERLSENIEIQLQETRGDLAKTKTEVSDLKESLEFTQSELDQTKSKMSLLEQENLKLRDSINKMQQKCDDKDLKLNSIENKLSIKILNIERYTRDFNVRLVGIEEDPEEDSRDIIAKYISKLNLLGEDMSEGDILSRIEIAHRTGKRSKNGRPRHIIARFHSRPIRNRLLRKFREINKITTPPLGFHFVEDMPQEDYELKRKARGKMRSAYEQHQKVKFRRGQLIIEGKVVPIE